MKTSVVTNNIFICRAFEKLIFHHQYCGIKNNYLQNMQLHQGNINKDKQTTDKKQTNGIELNIRFVLIVIISWQVNTQSMKNNKNKLE